MKTILVFGNEFVKEDSLAKEIASELENDAKHRKGLADIRFVHCNAPEDVLTYSDDEIFILDVAKGIDKVTLISDLDQLKSRKLYTAHDFDLSFFLKLMQKQKMLKKKVRIIAVPMGARISHLKKEVTDLIQAL